MDRCRLSGISQSPAVDVTPGTFGGDEISEVMFIDVNDLFDDGACVPGGAFVLKLCDVFDEITRKLLVTSGTVPVII